MIDQIMASGGLLVAMSVLAALAAFLAGSETAIFNVGLADLGSSSRHSVSMRERLARLVGRRQRLLVTILFANLIVNFGFFTLASLLVERFASAGHPVLAVMSSIACVVIFLVAAEVLPKVLAIQRSAEVAALADAPLRLIETVLWIPRVILSALTGVIARLLLGNRRGEGDIEAQELHELLSLAARDGHLAPDESERLQGVLVLSRLEAREIMTPRVNVIGFKLPNDRESFLALVAQHRFNKIPIFHESLDKIEGFLDAKEVISSPERQLDSLVRPVHFVPGSASVSQVMEKLRDHAIRVMVVVDEYGGTEGLITQEDLIEAVVGDLSDETDLPTPEVLHLGPGHYSVDGDMGISSWGRLVGRDVNELSVNTVGGLVMALLDRLPRVGDRAKLGRVELEVVAMKGRRASRVVVRLAAPGKKKRL